MSLGAWIHDESTLYVAERDDGVIDSRTFLDAANEALDREEYRVTLGAEHTSSFSPLWVDPVAYGEDYWDDSQWTKVRSTGEARGWKLVHAMDLNGVV